MTRIRAFVAVPLPADLAESYAAAQRALGGIRNVKWVERENLHLTLKFLGAVDGAAVPRISEALARVAARAEPALLTPLRVSAFPVAGAARVLVVELLDSSGSLGRLQAEVQRELAALGHAPEDREFRTHVTLGRVREGKTDARAALAAAAVPAGAWRVEEFELIESRLGPRGPAYTPLRSFRMGWRAPG